MARASCAHSSGWILLESIENTSRLTSSTSRDMGMPRISSAPVEGGGQAVFGVWRQAMVPPVARSAMRVMCIPPFVKPSYILSCLRPECKGATIF